MQPILFHIGPVAVPAYGFFVLTGLLVALALTPGCARRAGLDPAKLRESFFLIFLAGAVGCRLFFVLQHFPEVIRDPRPSYWIVQQAGVWYGAVLGGLIGGFWVVRKFDLPFWRTLDAAAIPAVVGGGVGRLGCFFSGCCHGKACTLPWAVTYTNETAHALHPALPYGPLHPTPLYEFGATLAIAWVLDRFGRTQRVPGEIGLLWLASYAAARFGLEYFRDDRIRGYAIEPWLTTSQAIGLAVIAATAISWFVRRRPGALPHFHFTPSGRP